MEVEAGKISFIPISNYAEQKAQERARMEFEYTQYIKKAAPRSCCDQIKQNRRALKDHLSAWEILKPDCTRWAVKGKAA